jgi:hypothetical protein
MISTVYGTFPRVETMFKSKFELIKCKKFSSVSTMMGQRTALKMDAMILKACTQLLQGY